MENHTYTIQIQTNHFDRELSREEYEAVAQGLLAEFDAAIEHYGLTPYIDRQASWMKGCVLENIILTFQDMDASTKTLTAMGTYVLLKDYAAISDSVTRLASHIRALSFVVGGLSVRVVRVVVNRGKSPALKHRIEPTIGDLNDVLESGDDERESQ